MDHRQCLDAACTMTHNIHMTGNSAQEAPLPPVGKIPVTDTQQTADAAAHNVRQHSAAVRSLKI